MLVGLLGRGMSFDSPKSIPSLASASQRFLCVPVIGIHQSGDGVCISTINFVLQAAVDLFEIASKRDVRPATVISK